MISPKHALEHSTVLAAFDTRSAPSNVSRIKPSTTPPGMAKVKWSAAGHRIFRPANEFERPLTP